VYLLLKCGEPLAERIDAGVLLLEGINLALLRGQLLVLRLQSLPCLHSLLLQFVVLLLQLVKQQGGELRVAHAHHLAVGPMNHQFRVHPLNLLGHQAVLQGPALIALVTKAHRPQPHQAGARTAHVVDVVLVTGRGREHSELAVIVDGYVGAHNRRAADSGNKGFVLHALEADANGVGFILAAAGKAGADVNIVAAGSDAASRTVANANVEAARAVPAEGV